MMMIQCLFRVRTRMQLKIIIKRTGRRIVCMRSTEVSHEPVDPSSIRSSMHVLTLSYVFLLNSTRAIGFWFILLARFYTESKTCRTRNTLTSLTHTHTYIRINSLRLDDWDTAEGSGATHFYYLSIDHLMHCTVDSKFIVFAAKICDECFLIS